MTKTQDPTLKTPDSRPKTQDPGSPEQPRTWARPHLLDLESLSAAEILAVLDTAHTLKEVSTRSIKKVPALRGKVMVNLFFEDSTRTKTSFTLAAQRLSADILDFSVSTSSVSKGETLRDTAHNIEAMGVDVIIIRHKSSGAPHLLARPSAHAAPSSTPATAPTNTPPRASSTSSPSANTSANQLSPQILDPLSPLSGLHVAIVGDIANSRVARSNIHGLAKLGAKITLVGPATLVPNDIEKTLPRPNPTSPTTSTPSSPPSMSSICSASNLNASPPPPSPAFANTPASSASTKNASSRPSPISSFFTPAP